MAKAALNELFAVDGVKTTHICIEPYRGDEVPQGVQTIRKELQDVDDSTFDQLGEKRLCCDSSLPRLITL